MKLYCITPKSGCNGYDVYDSAVVIAKSPQDARKIHPNGDPNWNGKTVSASGSHDGSWVNEDNVEVEYLGQAKKDADRGVVVASFNAG
jgi:flavodoxin